ncbi:MAG: excinuclease ABC subunit B [Phycisphaeraceae bacterium]|nr:MAG: excinuclease ABC subunit B [Phycisphaeraceae bacterium]
MLCARCGEREATIHEVVIDAQGNKAEEHLCEVCAAEAGLDANTQVPIGELISSFVVSGPGGEAQTAGSGRANATCPACGTTYGEFRRSGLLGCAGCYDAFEARLTPLLQRAHEGGTHHVGRSPREDAGEGADEDVARVAQLRRQLAEAVRSERYERAAQIQREIEELSGADEGGEHGA